VAISRFDYQSDNPKTEFVDVPPAAVLLFDGVFLQRPELRDRWDLIIYVHVAEAVSLARSVMRDVALFGSVQRLEARYSQRDLPAQALYRWEADPFAQARIVVDNTNPAAPRVVKWDLPRQR
jgi:uridine kinase